MKKNLKNLIIALTASTLFLASCGKSEVNVSSDVPEEKIETVITDDTKGEDIYLAGVYTGEADSIGGKIEVSVTVDKDSIQSIQFVEFNDSEFAFEPRDTMVDKIIKANGTNIDTISGATETSTAILNAVEIALSTALIGDTVEVVEINEEVEAYEDVTTEVVVIGGGGAGLSAAISATQNGANVVLIEKMSFLGGNTNYATGGLNASETSQQAALEIEDSVETFYNDTMEGGKNINNPELVDVLTKNSSKTVDWLTELGADLNDVGVLGGSTNNRTHRPTGGAPVGNHIVNVLSENAKELNVDVRVSTTAKEILVENNEVIGVIVGTEDDSEYTIFADSIIIATGGFGANNDLVASFVPSLKGYGTTNAPGATGDMLSFTNGLDIELVDMKEIQTHPTVMPSNNYMITEAVRGTGAILVNREGNRFVNELETRDVVSDAELAQTGQTAFLVFDQNVRDNLSAINGYYEKGFLLEASTIEELSEQLQLPEGSLLETVSTYNTYVSNGNDIDFERAKMESTIEVSPFYAVEVGPAVHHTMGGIKIDTDTKVYTSTGEYIEGLFACGEVTGGVHGANRLGGNAMADITTFGYIAGENAAIYSSNK